VTEEGGGRTGPRRETKGMENVRGREHKSLKGKGFPGARSMKREQDDLI